jgi:hypothetical protein
VEVDGHGDADLGVAEQVLDDLRVDALGQEQACGGVPQVVEADATQTGSLQDRMEGALDVLLVERRSAARGEDEVGDRRIDGTAGWRSVGRGGREVLSPGERRQAPRSLPRRPAGDETGLPRREQPFSADITVPCPAAIWTRSVTGSVPPAQPGIELSFRSRRLRLAVGLQLIAISGTRRYGYQPCEHVAHGHHPFLGSLSIVLVQCPPRCAR